MYRASPVKAFVPDLVTTFTAGPAVQPYSEEKAFESTVTSSTAPRGTVAIMVWRPRGIVSSRTPSITLGEARPIPTDLVKEGHA